MWRHQPVHHRKTRNHRQPHQDQRSSRAPGNGESNGNEQNKAHLEEDRQTHDQCRAHHGPGDVPLTEQVNQRLSDAVRGP